MSSPPIPLIVVGAAYAQALPAAALVARRNRSRPVRLVALVFLLNLLGDTVGQYVGRQTGNSIWLGSVNEMIAGPLMLFAFADWQVTYFERLMVRISVVPFLAIYGGLTYFFEDLSVLSRYSSPFLNIVLLGASTWTLLRRALTDTEQPILRTDWFFVLGGVALVMGTSAASTPIGAALLAQERYDLMAKVWELRAGFSLLGILSITLGSLLPEVGQRTA